MEKKKKIKSGKKAKIKAILLLIINFFANFQILVNASYFLVEQTKKLIKKLYQI